MENGLREFLAELMTALADGDEARVRELRTAYRTFDHELERLLSPNHYRMHTETPVKYITGVQGVQFMVHFLPQLQSYMHEFPKKYDI
jgi:hypothetical protein